MIASKAGALLFVVLALPWTRHVLERVMVTHMVVQIPLLILAGVLMTRALPASATSRIATWNARGVPGTLMALIVSSWWMVPRALDSVLASSAMEAAKLVTLPLFVGAPLALSWTPLGSVGRGFVIANALPMWAVVGWAYIVAPVRVCNFYLADQQVAAGLGVLSLSVALAVASAIVAVRRGTAGVGGFRLTSPEGEGAVTSTGTSLSGGSVESGGRFEVAVTCSRPMVPTPHDVGS